MPNQYKPVVPIELVEDHIRQFHLQGVSLKKMLPMLSKHYNTEIYGLGCVLYPPLPSLRPLFNCLSRMSKLKTYVKALGLTSARSQGHTFDTIAGPIAELRDMYPNAGTAELRTNLLNKFDMRVSKYVTILMLPSYI